MAEKADPNVRELLTEVPNATEGIKGGKTSPGKTALDLAVDLRSESMVLTLLKAKANPNAKSPYGYTPLMTACQSSLLPIVKMLIHAGANPNSLNENGDSAAVFAANNDFVDGLRVLKSVGASFKGKIGRNVLDTAITSSAEKSVKYLISIGVDLNSKDESGITPLEVSLLRNYELDEISVMLRKAGAKSRPVAVVKAESEARYKKYLREYKSKGIPGVVKDSIAETPTAEDIAIIQSGLIYLAQEKKFNEVGPDSEASKVALVNEIGREVGEYFEGQMNNELNERQANEIDFSMRLSLLKRNGVARPLKASPYSDSRIVLMDPAKAGGSMRFGETLAELEKVGAKTWIRMMVPGISSDGSKAVLRFSFGPTAHGASATMFLQRVGKEWKVQWVDYAYYA